jgi:adenylate cyclase
MDAFLTGTTQSGRPWHAGMKQLYDRFNTYPIPLAIRWSVSIAALVTLVMALLGWFLIGQQQVSYRQQTDLLGEMIIDQFARSASEPLMADDILSLEVLVSEQEKNELITGMQLFDLSGNTLARAGKRPFDDVQEGQEIIKQEVLPTGGDTQAWTNSDGSAVSYLKPVSFQNTPVGYALLAIDMRPLERELRGTLHALLLTTLGLIAVGVLLAFPLAYRFCRPIHHLVEVGEAFDRGDSCEVELLNRKDEIGRVLTTFRKMAEGMETKRLVENALSRYLSPSIAEKVISNNGASTLEGVRSEGSVLFCDIVGFTELSEQLELEEVAGLLNEFFHYFAVAGNSCQGTVDKFIGDCIMIVFGIPNFDELHGFHALTSAVLMQLVAERINARRVAKGEIAIQFRIGINSGIMLEGNLGSHERMQYTVVGDTVNVASRICALAEPGSVLLTGEAASQPGMREFVKPSNQGMIKVRGRKSPILAYETDIGLFRGNDLFRESLDSIFPE